MPGTSGKLQSLEWRGHQIPRLVSGTAQLGMAYGISNRAGVPSRSRAAAVIETALGCGIRFFDTAQAYGESESFLGAALAHCGLAGGVYVVSKLHPQLNPIDSEAIVRSLEKSVERLGGPLWAMLLHRPGWLDAWDDGLGAALREARRRGLVRYWGASVYTVDEAQRVLAQEAMDVVQVPANAWDQRILRGGIFRMAAARNKLCFVRSIFLQGLLTMPSQEVQVRLGLAHPPAECWENISRQKGLTPQALAIRCALALPAPLVVGMETPEQVRANAALLQLEALAEDELEEIHRAMSGLLNEEILNPSRWPTAV